MKQKFLRVTMPDGSQWDVPAILIASNRATYFAKADTGTSSGREFEREYAAELEYALNDDFELKDWAAGNMDWDDVVGQAVLVTKPRISVDYQEGWVNGMKEVIEREGSPS